MWNADPKGPSARNLGSGPGRRKAAHRDSRSCFEQFPCVARRVGARTSSMPLEVLFAGHYCHDTIVEKDGTQRAELGGAAAYASAVLLAARVDFRVAALVGDDFRYVVAKPPRIVAGARTTVFIEDYRGDDRTGTLVSAAPPLEPDDLGDARCQVGMGCAIAGEIGAGTLERLRELSGILIPDAQGFVRGFDARGRVFHRAPEPALRQQIDRLDWLKLSRSETQALHPPPPRRGGLGAGGGRRGP